MEAETMDTLETESDPGLVMNIDKKEEADETPEIIINEDGGASEGASGVAEGTEGQDEENLEQSSVDPDMDIEVTSEVGSECESTPQFESWAPVVVETPSEQTSEVGDSNLPEVEILELDQDIGSEAATGEDDPGSETVETDSTQPSLASENKCKSEPKTELLEEGTTILKKPDVFLYDISEKNDQTSRKAADWNLQDPVWCGTLELSAADGYCVLKLEDEDGTLFGKSVIREFPGEVLSTVSDSTRFFVLKIAKVSPGGGQDPEKLVGLGFSKRTDSADFTWALQNRLKGLFNPERSTDSNKEASRRKEERSYVKSKNVDSGFIMDTSSPLAQQTSHTPEQKSEGSCHVVVTGDIKDYIKKGLPTPGIFSCHLCPASFDDMRHIKSHWFKVHKLRHPVHCVHCKRPFPTAVKLREHRIEVHGFKCPDCQVKFKKQHALQAHYMKEHGEKLVYSCPLCTKKFGARSDLQNHVQASHKDDDGSSVLKKCPHCNKMNLEEELQGHISTHFKFIFCHVCDESFSSRKEIRQHMKESHDGASQLRL